MGKKFLKAKCVINGLSITDLADMVNINKATFYRKMNDDSFTTKEARDIARVLSLDANEIMGIFFADDDA